MVTDGYGESTVVGLLFVVMLCRFVNCLVTVMESVL